MQFSNQISLYLLFLREFILKNIFDHNQIPKHFIRLKRLILKIFQNIACIMKSVSLWQMRKIETIEEFYKSKFGEVPENIRNEIGHFNVFKLDPFLADNAKPVPYSRRDYFMIMLAIGNYWMYYADEVIEPIHSISKLQHRNS